MLLQNYAIFEISFPLSVSPQTTPFPIFQYTPDKKAVCEDTNCRRAENYFIVHPVVCVPTDNLLPNFPVHP